MFKNLMNALTHNTTEKTPDLAIKKQIAHMLQISPKQLDNFEKSYQLHALDFDDGSLFSVSSRKASQELHAETDCIPADTTVLQTVDQLIKRIVNELLVDTEVFRFDGKTATYGKFDSDTETTPVTAEEIKSLPKELRPQLTGHLMTKDCKDEGASEILLIMYNKMMKAKNVKDASMYYNQFRQGLDILDLDWLTYKIIDQNPISMGHWLPQLIEANADKDFFKIPKTTICKVPITLLQLTRLDYGRLTGTTLQILDKWAMEAFDLDETKEYFIRTGTHSSKFDFRNAHVHSAKEVRELGEYLVFIHNQGVIMAGPQITSESEKQPSIYGMSTTVEWVVREFIQDKENNPTIYKGLPLHTEYRVFVDCDTNMVLSIVPYWEPETMKQRFAHEDDANSPHQIHDYIIYEAHERTLMRRYYTNKNRIVSKLEELLPDLHLHGQWSIDIMQNGDDFWIIDMATAKNSAYYNSVPKELRHPLPEKWLPDLSM